MEKIDPRALRDAWNADYRMRGSLYGGAPLSLPDLPAGSLVLDLGCGNGKHSEAMRGRGWQVVGIDSAEEAIKASRRPDGALMVADACHLPFGDATFDAVIGIHILGHLPGYLRSLLIGEAGRVLAEDGSFHCTVFSRGDMRCGKGEEVEPYTYRRHHQITHYFSEDEIRHLKGPFRQLALRKERYKVSYAGEQYVREHFICTFTQ